QRLWRGAWQRRLRCGIWEGGSLGRWGARRERFGGRDGSALVTAPARGGETAPDAGSAAGPSGTQPSGTRPVRGRSWPVGPPPSRSPRPVVRVTAGQLLRVVSISVLAGVLLAMLCLPVVGLAGTVAKSGADSFLDLPSNLIAHPPPEPSRIVDAQGNEIAV